MRSDDLWRVATLLRKTPHPKRLSFWGIRLTRWTSIGILRTRALHPEEGS